MLFSKEVRLQELPNVRPESEDLKDISLAIEIRDERPYDRDIVGQTGHSLNEVITSDDVGKWFESHLTKELVNAGGTFDEDVQVGLVCKIKKCSTRVGNVSDIIATLMVDVNVVTGEREIELGILTAKISSYAFFETTGCHEQALSDVLAEWLKLHLPKLISTISTPNDEPRG